MRIFLLLFAALIVAGGTGYYAWQGLQPPAPVPVAAVAAPKPTEVFVASSKLSVGTIIRPDQLGRMAIAKAAITPEMVVADEAGETLLVGSVARQDLPQGVPIARSATVQPGDRGFLAAVLPKGKRAVSIPIGEVAGVSGLVLPGDRVDIILTYSVTAELMDETRDIRASETVVTNLRVLALDQRLGKGDPSVMPGSKDAPGIARAATLEVTPQQAEMITLATTLGDLSLVLNSVRDGGEPKPDAPDTLDRVSGRIPGSAEKLLAPLPRKLTLDSDVTTLLNRENDPKVEERIRAAAIQVVRGRTSSAVFYGGDQTPGATQPDAAPTAAPGAQN